MSDIQFTAEFYRSYTVISVELTKSGTLEVIKKYPSNTAYGNGQPCPDEVVKEVYGVGDDGRIMLVAEIIGTHTTAHYVKEKISFSP